MCLLNIFLALTFAPRLHEKSTSFTSMANRRRKKDDNDNDHEMSAKTTRVVLIVN